MLLFEDVSEDVLNAKLIKSTYLNYIQCTISAVVGRVNGMVTITVVENRNFRRG